MFQKIKIFIFSIVFLIIIFFPILSFAEGSKFYQLSLNYSKGNVRLKDVIVLPGDISRVNPGGTYKAELFSFSNTSLYKTNFDIPTSIHGEDFDYETGRVTSKNLQLDNVDFILNIPYFPNGKEIDVYDPQNKKILTISVAHFAEVTPTSVPEQIFTPTKLEKGSMWPWAVGSGVLILLIGASAFIYLKLKSKDLT